MNGRTERISAEEYMSIPEIPKKYPSIEIPSVEEDRPAEEK